eukprot:CAMPEP_0206439826 /NCGR_PEP_ID=MMETSP0324_2-20121206/12426_1 /ASSEMBLY_ACC=CAM_ASM_000836 /TAXON_ID=2866 /ORGANISM="Crypthecodinium cohnii, Strain Seligo" /LENGTH=246 /DNA_ID=CAMNT_0053907489 /DNA_START=88 /DNA_END=828 /DNA_ORIENTATION=-
MSTLAFQVASADIDGNLTTFTTTSTRPSLWIVTGPCPIINEGRGRCIASPNWPHPYEDGGSCTFRINVDAVEDWNSIRSTLFYLSVWFGFDDNETSMMVDTDSPAQMLRPAELNSRIITGNDTIYWSSEAWTSTSGWYICFDAMWLERPNGTGGMASAYMYPCGNTCRVGSEVSGGSGSWGRHLVWIGIAAALAACQRARRKAKQAREEAPIQRTTPRTDLEVGVAGTSAPPAEVVHVSPEHVQRV